MFWISLLISLAFTVVGELLRPKPRFDTPKPSSLGDYRAPTADETRPIPVAYGTVRVTGPNAVWWGDFEPRAIKKRIKTGMFSSKRITLGYQYWLGLQLGICWGEIDELISLEFDDQLVPFIGRIDGADEITFEMDAPTLLSSDEPRNGVKGSVRFYRGTFTQSQSDYLAGQFDEATIPAYRGVCYAVFEKCYLSNNDSVPPIAWTIRRTPNTLGLTAGRENINGDANAACAIYEIMTNTNWGAGVPQAMVDLPSFVAAANQLAAENLGISMLIDRSGSADDIIAEILRHVDGVVYIDPESGLFTIKLARADYDVETIPEINPSNIDSEGFKFTRGSWDETKNTVQITYVDRSASFTDRMVQHQNLANITARGGQVDSESYDFRGLSNATAANQVAARVLRTVSSPLSRLDCALNLTVPSLRPGSVVKLVWPPLGIAQLVMRIVEIDYGTLDNGLVRIRAVEDIFGVATVSFSNPPVGGWTNPLDANLPLARQSAFEFPYGMTAPDAGRYIAVTGSPASGPQRAYTLWQDTAGGSAFTEDPASQPFTPSAALQAQLPGNTAALVTTTITLNAAIGMSAVVSATQSEFDAGESLARIVSAAGEEIVAWRTIVDNGNGTFSWSHILRGQYDTIPLTHPAGAVVWFITDGMAQANETAYTTTVNTVTLRATPFGVRSKLPLASATTMTVARIDRATRPYPPGNLRFNTVYLPSTFTGALTVAWSPRNRLTQARLPYAQSGSDVTVEASTTHTVRFYDENGTLRRTYSGLTATSQAWDTELSDCNLFSVLNPSPPAQQVGARDNLIYMYPMDDLASTTATRDLEITSPLDLVVASSPGRQQPTVRVGGGNSTSYTSTQRSVSTAAATELVAAARCSVSAWVRFTAWSTTNNAIFWVGGGSETEPDNERGTLYTDANRRLVWRHEYGAGVDEIVVASGMTPLALNTDYHIVVTQDRNTGTGTNEIRFYVNGSLVDTRPYTNVQTGGTSNLARLVLGNGAFSASAALSLNGRLQDIFFTTDLLTATEITWLYNSGTGRSAFETLNVIARLNNQVTVEVEAVRSAVTSRVPARWTATRV